MNMQARDHGPFYPSKSNSAKCVIKIIRIYLSQDLHIPHVQFVSLVYSRRKKNIKNFSLLCLEPNNEVLDNALQFCIVSFAN